MKGGHPDLSFDAYLKGQENNLAQIRRLPVFRDLVLPVKELYERAADLVPPGTPPSFGRILLLGHKSLLSAAALIARGLPDDAAGITRRAIEAVRTGRAIKHDRGNLDRWSPGTVTAPACAGTPGPRQGPAGARTRGRCRASGARARRVASGGLGTGDADEDARDELLGGDAGEAGGLHVADALGGCSP